MSHRFLQANAFTSAPFAGNPAAVVLLHEAQPDAWMQLVARDFNLSETAFLLPTSTCGGGWSLRWFTPRAEVDLCGHATLASVHALREWNLLSQEEEARFHTRSGVLSARCAGNEIALDFPSMPPHQIGAPRGLASALGLEEGEVLWCGRSDFDIVLQLGSAGDVAFVNPDFAALSGFEVRGICVTAPGENYNCDFVSRFFAPRLGIDEDPVTGSAHCCLAPFWAEKLGKSELRALQISERGGELRLQVLGERIELRGECVTILRGEVLR